GSSAFRHFEGSTGSSMAQARCCGGCFGIVPVMTASGRDITRSVAGRMKIESLWLPSVLVRGDVRWTARNACHAAGVFGSQTEPVEFEIDERGRLQFGPDAELGQP